MNESIIDLGVTSSNTSSKYVEVLAFQQSQEWSPEQDCIANIIVIGGGASGAVHSGTSYFAHGGGAGGLCYKKDVALKADESYSMLVGAGGRQVSLVNGGYGSGANGGNSSISNVSKQLNMIANGGNRAIGNSSEQNPLGGDATGGDINLVGGNGGVARQTRQAAGGGAVNIGHGSFSANNPYSYAVSGGAGVGGRSESSQINFRGGKSVPYSEILDFMPFLLSNTPDKSVIAEAAYPLISAQNHSNSNTLPTKPDLGVGGFGFGVHHTEATINAAQDGGLFAGGGGCYVLEGSDFGAGAAIMGGNGGNFGGGGGGAGCWGGNMLVTSGRGGDGIVFIAIKEYL